MRFEEYTESEDEIIRQLLASGLSPTEAAARMIEDGSIRPFDGLIKKVVRVRRDMLRELMRPDAPTPSMGPESNEGHIVGVIGDTHHPFCLPEYLEFCATAFADWGVTRVVHIGDAVDNHAMSYHESCTDGMSAGDEMIRAMEEMQKWYKAFPVVGWVQGNHDRLPRRKIQTAGLPSRMLKRNVYEAPPGWIQGESFMIDNVLYTHGLGSSGENGARNLARRRAVSCVVGHYHRSMGVAYTPSHDGGYLCGLQVGCGVDHESYAMEYGRDYGRMALGCGIFRYGKEAHSIPMLRGYVQGGVE